MGNGVWGYGDKRSWGQLGKGNGKEVGHGHCVGETECGSRCVGQRTKNLMWEAELNWGIQGKVIVVCSTTSKAQGLGIPERRLNGSVWQYWGNMATAGQCL